jgi:hypothetical protein
MSLNKILNDRQKEYGDAKENFRKIGVMWGLILDLPFPIAEYQVAQMMIALKIQRISANPDHQDSWLDIQGYAKHGLDSL